MGLIKRARIDDRHLGNGSSTPKLECPKGFHTTSVDSGHLDLRAIESPVLNRFRYLGIRDAFRSRKIGNRARNLENPMIGAR